MHSHFRYIQRDQTQHKTKNKREISSRTYIFMSHVYKEIDNHQTQPYLYKPINILLSNRNKNEWWLCVT